MRRQLASSCQLALLLVFATITALFFGGATARAQQVVQPYQPYAAYISSRSSTWDDFSGLRGDSNRERARYTGDVQDKLSKLRCYRGTTDRVWGDLSREALRRFRDDVAIGQSLTFDRPVDFLSFLDGHYNSGRRCRGSGPADFENVKGRCSFPSSGDAWLASLKLRATADDPNTLGAILRHLSRAVDDYGNYIPPAADLDLSWLGDDHVDAITDARNEMMLKIQELLAVKSILAKYGAISTNPVCAKCVLLEDFDMLVALTGPPGGGVRKIYDTEIDINEIDFATLREAHTLIAEVALHYRDYLSKFQRISPASSSHDSLLAAASAKQRFDAAKKDLTVFLEKRMRERQPAKDDLVAAFSERRQQFCGGEVKVPGYTRPSE